MRRDVERAPDAAQITPGQLFQPHGPASASLRAISPSVVARVAQISRQTIYDVSKSRPGAARRARPPADEVEAAIAAVAEDNQTDGYRMVCGLVTRKLGRAVNRKRVLRERRVHLVPQPRPLLDQAGAVSVRWRTTRVCSSGAYTSGRKSAAPSCASTRASTLSVLTFADTTAFCASG